MRIFTYYCDLREVVAGTLTQALSYTSLAVVAALVGGVIAVYRAPGPQMESNVQHLAAGVVFAAVAAELLPGIHRLSKFIEKRGVGGNLAGAAGLIITISIDMLIDGVRIAVTFIEETATGIIIALALTIEVLFLGVAAVVALPGKMGKIRKIAVPAMFGVLLIVGVTVGVLTLESAAQATIAFILAFGAAALLYLVTEELLVKASKVPQTSVSTTLFFVGFLVIFVIDIIG